MAGTETTANPAKAVAKRGAKTPVGSPRVASGRVQPSKAQAKAPASVPARKPRAAGTAKPVTPVKPATRQAPSRANAKVSGAKVSKVVSRTAGTAVPQLKASKPGPAVVQSSRAQASAPARKAKPAKVGARPPAARNHPAARAGTKGRVRYVAPPLREVKVKELDPVARCGPDTSVEFLYRVDERLDGRAAGVHLVFFDRYGWYCVHGRGCAAVADVHQDLRAQRRSVPRLATTTRALGR